MRVLRAHHLLCIHGFQGMGYSPEFVVNMGAIVREMKEKEGSFPVQVVAAGDHICNHCPNRQGEICATAEDQVREMDRRVLVHLGLRERNIYDRDELLRLTAERVEADDLQRLCADCSWLSYGVCEEGIRSLKERLLGHQAQRDENHNDSQRPQQGLGGQAGSNARPQLSPAKSPQSQEDDQLAHNMVQEEMGNGSYEGRNQNDKHRCGGGDMRGK